jgi:hypothetical protein
MPHFIFIQQISVLNILNMLYNLHFLSSKCRLFHNATLFGFCITHIFNTGVLKFEKKKSVAKRLTKGHVFNDFHTIEHYAQQNYFNSELSIHHHFPYHNITTITLKHLSTKRPSA